MISLRVLSSALVIAGVAAIGFSGTADAHKRKYKHSHSKAPYCHARMEGRATGQGLFGAGSAQARTFAVAEWESKVQDRWGPNYASFSKARGVTWDCKKNAILKAKCVVTAMPCR